MEEGIEVRCDRCGEIVGRDSPAWVELAGGGLRIVVFGDFDDPQAFKRAWHQRCLGAA